MLVLYAGVTRFQTMADGSGRITVDTQELTPKQFSEIGKINKKQGVFVFKPEVEAMSEEELQAIEDVEMESSPLKDRKKKSKSQTLRSTLFLNWQQDNEGYDNFTEFYNYHLDYLIGHYKELLDG